MRKNILFLILLFLVGIPIHSIFPVTEQLINVATRKNKIQPYLLSTENNLNPKYAVVLFPGGEGNIGLHEEKDKFKITYGGNFLVRSRKYFIDLQFATAIIDSPSDQKNGMDDFFRSSKAHAEDVEKVISDLKSRFQNVKIYLVGTSRGTISAAYAGKQLGSLIDGIVLTSSIFKSGKKSGQIEIASFPYSGLKTPVLFVHHAEDQCPVTPYREAERISNEMHLPLITVHGGLPPKSGPCDPFSEHGYFGKEKETIAAIKDWILGLPIKKDIE